MIIAFFINLVKSLWLRIVSDWNPHQECLGTLIPVKKVSLCPYQHWVGKQAYLCYMEAIRLQPTFAIAWSNLAGLLMEAGELQKALTYYKVCNTVTRYFCCEEQLFL
jgi:tetratricopeptide (TPR) repeat protein